MNDTGLPLPGRELDLEMARILGYEIVSRHRDATEETYILDCGVPGTNLWFIGPGMAAPKKWAPSTTHGFFQVMGTTDEPSEKRWHFKEHTRCLFALLFRNQQHQVDFECDVAEPANKPAWVCVNWADYPDREHAYAHVVCCCAWKARHDEV